MMSTDTTAEVYPLIWTGNVAALADWGVAVLGLTESWRAPGEDGRIEHAELLWLQGRISNNIRKAGEHTGPSGISLRVDDRRQVEALYDRAQGCNANITQPLMDSRIAYSFTVNDPDNNQWWVNAETGFLDSLRS